MDSHAEDLRAERSRASFPVREMVDFLNGGPENTARIERMQQIVQTNSEFGKRERIFQNHARQHLRAVEKVRRIEELRWELGLDATELGVLKSEVDENLPTTLHDLAFVPTLRAMCDDEQKEKWLQAALELRIIGCYAQTELGHGSNIRGLETTATYDAKTDEFDIHSPTLTSTKWWPGCMGKVATHAVVYANLLLNGENKGVLPFMVQIRSLEDLSLLPGVTAGDIGPKLGYQGVDNGFMRLDHVRVPRTHLLGRTGSVSRAGVFSPPQRGDQKSKYASMLGIRAGMVQSAGRALGRAVTVGVRYLSGRRQFSLEAGTPENSVLDYKGVQMRVFCELANSYALLFTGLYMRRMYANFQAGDASLLPELHASAAGLKSHTTAMGADGIEVVRRACGGHGYSALSGLPDLVTSYTGMCTAEGDNFLLPIQTTKYLLKMLREAQSGGRVIGNADYLQDVAATLSQPPPSTDWRDPQTQLHAYRHRTAAMVVALASGLQESMAGGMAPAIAMNEAQWEVLRVSQAHCQLTMVVAFASELRELQSAHPRLYPVLKRLSDLFALRQLELNMSELLEDGYMGGESAASLRATVRELLSELRADAVALVDSFNFSDHFLNSAIGQKEGRVYENLWDWAQEEPLNNLKDNSAYQRNLLPLLNGRVQQRSKL